MYIWDLSRTCSTETTKYNACIKDDEEFYKECPKCIILLKIYYHNLKRSIMLQIITMFLI